MNRILSILTIVCTCGNAFGMGGNYPTNQPVAQSGWPAGVKDLVNRTNRVGGLWVNAEDIFFFSGSAADFNQFLAAYSKIQPVDDHRIMLHAGVGEAYSLGGGDRRPCDWELYGCPKGWLNLAKLTAQGTNAVETLRRGGNDTNYVLEIHFWTGGRISLGDLIVPSKVTFAGDCFTNFASITNGMTRAEVEKKLPMDGGLRSVSPVRFIDPACPGFKVDVEFSFKRDAVDGNRAIESPDDRVIRVSPPYRQLPFLD